MSVEQPLDLMTFDELAQARYLIRDLANTGVCNPHELKHLWTVADRIDDAVTAKRQGERNPETPVAP
jgi:hypothetical protein